MRVARSAASAVSRSRLAPLLQQQPKHQSRIANRMAYL
ncbi:hypothetical protein GLE_0099 [Lysobacter enzymogenes]|uniref:Uncharacterized protein n=1 Tax=Lysobacter enzymogenes TaxID=69 RepID=A0A0S2DA76_LYSEN|nr:hypothetical protein GLE_0099 [Lysobacter enzymogenes]